MSLRLNRIHPAVVDAVLVAVALVDTLNYCDLTAPVQVVLGAVSATGLFLRRRWPWLSLALVLPGVAVSSAFVAGLIALYSVAVIERRRWALALAGIAFFIAASGTLLGELFVDGPADLLTSDPIGTLTFAVMAIATPIALGLLVRTRRELTARLVDLEQARDTERRHADDEILATERARIAREMHDVVSHQVSLIAVQSGALQIDASEPSVISAARTIRSLAVRTLDELRQMVSVLRVDGTQPGQLAPQPTLADLSELIRSSGIPTTTDIDLPADLPASVPRTIYRTVQEGLTNIRKHAPGAAASITAQATGGFVTVIVRNSAATSPSMDLPSARHGIVGLRERADLLGGTLTAQPDPDGGHTLTLRIPRP